jgi:tetratricopeptide (TPR) repeat protein
MKWPSTPVIVAVLAVGVPLATNLWITLGQRLAPSPAAVHVARGDRAMAEGRYPDAVIAFGRAQKLDPGSAAADLGVMRARVHGVAEEPSRLRDEHEAELRYDAELLLAHDPASAAACHVALGHLAARKGDLASARAKYEEALKLDPSSPLAHIALGNAYLNDRDRAAQAAAEFEAALKARPGHPSALIGLARVALGKGEAQEAVRHLNAALAARDDFNAHMLLGNAQVRLKNLTDGIAHLERAVQLEPQNAEALRSLGQALMAADRSAEAERPLRAAVQLQDDAEAATTLGFALARQRRHAAALDVFTRVLTREPESPLALFGAGVSLEELGKRDEAATSYRRLLALKPPPGRDVPGLAQVQEDAKQRLAALEAGPPEPSPAPGDIAAGRR